MTEEVTKFLKALNDAGQTGTIVLIIILCVLVIAGLWMFFLQKRMISLTIDAQKVIDSKIKAADALREESRKNQEFASQDISSRIDSLININDELRKEIDRLAKQQKSLADSQSAFRQSVKDSISVGLEDIKERLTSVKVTEILDQIPENFRNDLQNSLVDVSKQVIQDTVTRLKETPADIIDYNSLSREIHHVIAKAMEDFSFPWMHPDFREDWRYRSDNYGYREYQERYFDFLAERIAYHLRRYQ